MLVMPGLVRAIHAFENKQTKKTWMAGTGPAMTWWIDQTLGHRRPARGGRHFARHRPGPRPMVDGLHAPFVSADLGREVVHAGDRAIVDGEGERRLALEAGRERQRRLDGAAVGDRHDGAAGTLRGEPLDRAAGARDEIVETLPPRGAAVGGGGPERPPRHPA